MPAESPTDAVERELAEELRVSWKPGRLLVVDRAPRLAEGDTILFIFDGGIISRKGGLGSET